MQSSSRVVLQAVSAAGQEPAAGKVLLFCMQSDEPVQISRYAYDFKYNLSFVHFSIKCSN